MIKLNFTKSDELFRSEIKDWINDNLPKKIQQKVHNHLRLTRDDYLTWHRIVAKKGWVAPNWPEKYGGTGWTKLQQMIWEEECADAGAPIIITFGINMVGPVIMKFGTEVQKKNLLPKIFSGEDWWCQGYSEPGSGSDLASLKTSAIRQGDFYIVNGQKTWTTLAQHANMMFCLVKTDSNVRNQDGISFILIDMKSPGIEVKPLITIDEDHEINNVFLSDVKVPVENLIGGENKGWTYAKYLLSNERTGIAAVGRSKYELKFLKKLALKIKKNDKPLIFDPIFMSKISALEIELMALEVTVLRVIYEEERNRVPGPEASMLKIKGTEIQQKLTELMIEIAGPLSIPFDIDYLNSKTDNSIFNLNDFSPLMPYYFNYRKTSIYGGTNEIQKNIIGKMILGL